MWVLLEWSHDENHCNGVVASREPNPYGRRLLQEQRDCGAPSTQTEDRREHDVSGRARTRGWSSGRVVVAGTATLAMTFVAVSCDESGDDAGVGGDAATDAPAGTLDGGASATNGEQLARSNGCAGCHGSDFGGGAGPSLVGLAGSDVTLADGTTVVADTDYLTRSIAQPSADLVADYNLKMPANTLSDAEIADIVTFIETLADG